MTIPTTISFEQAVSSVLAAADRVRDAGGLVLGDVDSESAYIGAGRALLVFRQFDGVSSLGRSRTVRRAVQELDVAVGELVTKISGRLSQRLTRRVSNSMRRADPTVDTSQRSDVGAHVYMLLHGADFEVELPVLQWVGQRLHRSCRTLTNELSNVNWRHIDDAVVRTAHNIRQDDIDRGSTASGAHRPAFDDTALTELVRQTFTERVVGQLQAHACNASSADVHSLAAARLKRRGLDAALAHLPNMLAVSDGGLSLDAPVSETGTTLGETVNITAEEHSSLDVLFCLLNSSEAEALEQQLHALAADGSGSTPSASVLERQRSVLCAPHVHWARLSTAASDQFINSVDELDDGVVAAIASRLA